MNKKIRKTSLLSMGLFLLVPFIAFAHQPRIIESGTRSVVINSPEVSQAFYGKLTGAPVQFQIKSEKPFNLYVGLLVPDIPDIYKDNIQTDISVEISRFNNGQSETIALLAGNGFKWTPFFEEFAGDNYLWGPEYKAYDSQKGLELKGQPVSAGLYSIKIFNSTNTGKYTLVTGYNEVFPISEIINSIIVVPRLKAQFFNYSIINLIISPYVFGYILLMYILGFLVAFTYRAVLKKFAKDTPMGLNNNIGTSDRYVRFVLGLALLVSAVTTTWSPVSLFFSGFCFFEAIFSWCGFYAALGKNTCPIGLG